MQRLLNGGFGGRKAVHTVIREAARSRVVGGRCGQGRLTSRRIVELQVSGHVEVLAMQHLAYVALDGYLLRFLVERDNAEHALGCEHVDGAQLDQGEQYVRKSESCRVLVEMVSALLEKVLEQLDVLCLNLLDFVALDEERSIVGEELERAQQREFDFAQGELRELLAKLEKELAVGGPKSVRPA